MEQDLMNTTEHNPIKVQKMANKQFNALALFAGTTIASLMLTAVNVEAIVTEGWHVVLLCQMPMALTGFYLGYTLMTAGRKEGLNSD